MAEQGDVIRLTVIIELPSSVIGNLVTYFRQVGVTSTDNATVAADMAAKIETDFLADLDTILSDEVSWTRADFALWDTVLEEWNTFAQVPLTNLDGVSLTSFETHATAGLVKFFTNQARRQGRKYIPGIISTTIAYSLWNGTAVAALLAWGSAWVDGWVGDSVGFNMGVWNETMGFKAFTGDVEVNDQAGGQDRRMPGVGT